MKAVEALALVGGHAARLMLFPSAEPEREGPVECKERLGGLLKFYHRAAA